MHQWAIRPMWRQWKVCFGSLSFGAAVLRTSTSEQCPWYNSPVCRHEIRKSSTWPEFELKTPTAAHSPRPTWTGHSHNHGDKKPIHEQTYHFSNYPICKAYRVTEAARAITQRSIRHDHDNDDVSYRFPISKANRVAEPSRPISSGIHYHDNFIIGISYRWAHHHLHPELNTIVEAS